MADQKKRLVVVLESEGQEKVKAQVESMTAAAVRMGTILDSSFSSFNDKTNKVRTSFQLTIDQATKLETAISKVQRALQEKGLSRWTSASGGVFKIETDLSRISEGKAPTAAAQGGGVFTEEWKAQNALRAEANRKLWAEQAAAQKETERLARESAKRQAADYILFWKQALAEKSREEQLAEQKKQSLFSASVRAQQTAMSQQLAIGKASAFFGEGSQQAAQARAAIQEAAIRASLSAQIQKIQTQYSEGKFGIKAADNRVAAAFSSAQKDLNALNVELAKHKKALQEAEVTQTSFAARVLESISIYRLFNAALNLTGAALKSVPQVGIQLEQTNATLTAVFGSFGQAAQQMAFLNAEAERTGLKLEDLRKSYATFSASALLAGQSAATVQKIFADVNTTATTLHLTTDQVNGVFLALSQMFNKGKVQAEELTKQLSQTLPGITNQAAKALGISAAQLGEEMKKGLITADDAVQKMMARMADAFGGDAFKRASSNLYSELGRLSTAWTHLAENAYKATEGTMTSTVRWATSLVETLGKIVSNTYETERAISSLATGTGVVLVGALGTMAVKAIAASKTIADLRAGIITLEVVASRFAPVALFTGLAGIVTYALNARNALNDAREAAAELRKEQETSKKSPALQAEDIISSDPEVQKFRGRIAALKKQRDEFALLEGSEKRKEQSARVMGLPTPAEINKDLEVLERGLAKKEDLLRKELADKREAERFSYSPLADSDKVTKIQLQNEAAKLKREGKDREAAVLEAKAGFADELKILQEEKARIDKVLYDTASVTYGDYQQALKDSATVDAQIKEIQTRTATAGDKTKPGEVSKQLRTSMYETSVDIQRSQNAISASLEETESAFARNVISIKDYYEKRRTLGTQDVALQQQELQEQIALASAAGETAKVKQLELKALELSGKARRDNEKSLREERAAYQDLTDNIKDLNAEYLAMLGKGEGSATTEFEKKYRKLKKEMEAEQLSPHSAESKGMVDEGLRQYESRKSYIAATEEATKKQSEYILVREELAAKEQRIQNGLKLGSISELEGLYQTQKARQEAVKSMDLLLEAQEKALAGQPEGSEAVRKVKQLRLELENLAADSNVFADKFNNIFASSFANAFSEFRRGSLTAKEAFSSFATSVIDNIAKIAEQAVAQQIFGYLGKLVGGISLGSSGTGDAAGIEAGTYAASGGAFAGMHSVSGTVLNRPTYFPGANVIPFASGGVLAGEAGAEGVFPLKRGKNGKLGISAEGSGGKTIVIQNLSVTVMQKEESTPQDQAMLIGKTIKDQLSVMVEEKLAMSVRPGKTLNPTQLTATF